MVGPSRPAAATWLAWSLVIVSVLLPGQVPAAESDAARGQDLRPRSQADAFGQRLRGLAFLDRPSDMSHLGVATFRPRKRFAVCVGIDGYQEGSGYSNLQFAGRDAVGVADALLEACQFDHDCC